jgi:hypothetical protein
MIKSTTAFGATVFDKVSASAVLFGLDGRANLHLADSRSSSS